METNHSKDGATSNGVTAPAVEVPDGSPVQINVEAARPPDLLTSEEIRANTDQLAAVLASPTVVQVVEGVMLWLQTRAAAETEKAKVQSAATAEADKLRAAASEQAHRLNADVAGKFLRNLLVLGLAALALLAWMAWTRVVDGQVFSVLATVIITSVFGGTIYGTTLRPKDKA
jgi:hypothetical protein